MGIWLTIVEAITKDSADDIIPKAANVIVPQAVARSGVMSDQRVVVHHVINGRCGEDFATAMSECHPNPSKAFMQERGDAADRVVDAKACIKATMTLRKCFAGNPAMFKHQYLCRMDNGFDQDTKPSPELVTPAAMGSVVSFINYTSDVNLVNHHMANGGCIDEFMTAISECHPDVIERRADPAKRVVDAEECARATAALRKCFGRNPQWFEHQYIHRLDHRLDQDVKPSPKQVKEEDDYRWRWWTGMRRS